MEFISRIVLLFIDSDVTWSIKAYLYQKSFHNLKYMNIFSVPRIIAFIYLYPVYLHIYAQILQYSVEPFVTVCLFLISFNTSI